jgi:hypothetical protein
MPMACKTPLKKVTDAAIFSLFIIIALAAISCLTLASPPTIQAPGLIQPTWNITFGGARTDEGWGVAVGADGSVYFAGLDRIDPGRVTADVFLKKVKSDGVSVWNSSWGGAFDDEAFVVTTSGDYVYVGGRSFTSFSLASGDLMILKFHASNGSLE